MKVCRKIFIIKTINAQTCYKIEKISMYIVIVIILLYCVIRFILSYKNFSLYREQEIKNNELRLIDILKDEGMTKDEGMKGEDVKLYN